MEKWLAAWPFDYRARRVAKAATDRHGYALKPNPKAVHWVA